MSNIPSKGKLRIIYYAIDPDQPVSRRDLEKIIEKLSEEYPDKTFSPGDIENLLYRERGFMIPHPQKGGYFVRGDSTLALEFNNKTVSPVPESNLKMSDSQVNTGQYTIYFKGPGIDSKIQVTDTDDLQIVEATLLKISKQLKKTDLEPNNVE